MGESEKRSDLEETLKPFYQRASEAEERLSRLEAALGSKKPCSDAGNEDHLRLISELQSQLEETKAELVSERVKAQKLAEENAKLQYRVTHLVGAVREADLKLESKS